MPSILPTQYLLRPRELHGAISPEHYLQMQAASIRAKMRQFPFLNWQPPFVYAGTVPLKVSDSCWQLVCECGNFPAYDPEWEMACCFSCGAVYYQPPPSDWRDIQRVLVNRPRLQNRHMLPGQTLNDLMRENLEHGDAI